MTKYNHEERSARCAVCDYHPVLSNEESRHVLWDDTHQEYVCQFCYNSIHDALWYFTEEDQKAHDKINATAPRKPVHGDPKAGSIDTSQTMEIPFSEPSKGNPCGDSECGRFCECEEVN